MLFELTDEQMAELRAEHTTVDSAMFSLLASAGLPSERIEKLRYPSIKYARTEEERWEEMDKCFNVKYKKVYENKLRPKYLNGEEWRRVR